ncbi:MAG TPA: hypothetical protein PLJ60_02110 [Chryseolinea sp.]|nr:hypothetical protein [Chryseolinea sp.]HPM29104.1 hypothetical protein [Chryseolinea sp.]
MKFGQLFTKIPNYKRFGYTPRHYHPMDEELKERELRITEEFEKEKKLKENAELNQVEEGHRHRISGSFRVAKKTVPVQADPSAALVRLALMLVMVVGFICYLQFGNIALYGVALVIIPVYLIIKFRKIRR